MGLIDFIVDAGKSLFADDEKPVSTPTPAERAAQLYKRVMGLGLAGKGVKVDMKGSKAILTGEVTSQEEKEKIILAVGNTEGVGQVDDQMTVIDPAPPAVYYTVVRGDTLSGIAKKQYGKAGKYPVIFEANKPMLKDPDLIYPGQVLRIPPLD